VKQKQGAMTGRSVIRGKRLQFKQLNSVLACAASLVLTGVPPVVCESVLDEVVYSFRKSIVRMIG
jgi:hypothetical protein